MDRRESGLRRRRTDDMPIAVIATHYKTCMHR